MRLNPPPAAGQWAEPRQGSYIGQSQDVLATSNDAGLGTSAGVPDEDILQAAQLLLPSTTYRDTC